MKKFLLGLSIVLTVLTLVGAACVFVGQAHTALFTVPMLLALVCIVAYRNMK